MTIRKRLLFGLLFLISTAAAMNAAGTKTHVLSRRTEVFENKNCESTGTCDLKSVTFVAEQYRVGAPGDYGYGTRFYAEYETDSHAAVKKYIFVQFIKGCLYSSSMKNGMLAIQYGWGLKHFGKYMRFMFRGWEIDSTDRDPAYASEEKDRYCYLLWTTKADHFSRSKRYFYEKKRPRIPKVFVTDTPTGAFFQNGEAQNASLEFKTCIYKASDVPQELADGETVHATPLNCFEWSSSFIYNYEKNEFENPQGIATPCRP